MAEIPTPSILRSAAYRLFLEEVRRHLDEALRALSTAQPLDAPMCTKLGAAFHTIRGSSGFFGLSTIAETAKQLEQLLLAPDAAAQVTVAQILPLVQQLDALSRALPAPTAG